MQCTALHAMVYDVYLVRQTMGNKTYNYRHLIVDLSHQQLWPPCYHMIHMAYPAVSLSHGLSSNPLRLICATAPAILQ